MKNKPKTKYILLVDKEKTYLPNIEDIALQIKNIDSISLLKKDIEYLVNLTFEEDYFKKNKYCFPKEIDTSNLFIFKSDLSYQIYFKVYLLVI